MRDSGSRMRDDRHQHQPHALDQVGQPERQVALQQRRAACVEALGLRRERPLAVRCAREVALALEPAGVAVHLLRRLDEQLDQRRVRAAARQQRGGRRDQAHIVRRQVARQVDHAARQHHRAEEGEAARVGLALREVDQPDAGRLQQHLHHQRFGRRGEHQRVELAVEKATIAGVCVQRASFIVAGSMRLASSSGAIRLRHAAARGADVDAPAGELRQAGAASGALQQPLRRRRRGRTATPARRTGCRARPGRRRRRPRRRSRDVVVGAALHEGEVDARAGRAAARRFSAAPCGAAQFDLDAVLLQAAAA